jgi:hypothetical protein
MAEEINLKDEIIRMMDREPFVPFKIVMNSGDRYEVTDPHSIAVGRDVAVLIPPRSTTVWMRMSQISSVEATEPVA